MTTPHVDGVILAAGRSTRMAQPKPLLTFGQHTFLQRAARTLRSAGCRRTFVVAHEAATWLDHAAALDLDVVINPDPDSEQIDSLRHAIRAIPDTTDGVLVLPVDMPLITESTAAAVVAAFLAQPAPLVLPFHNTVAGHPVLIGRPLFEELLEAALTEGLRSLIMDHAHDLQEVRVDDQGILIDIDTPGDYQRSIGSG